MGKTDGLILAAGLALVAFLVKPATSSNAAQPALPSPASPPLPSAPVLPSLTPLDLSDPNAFQVIDVPGFYAQGSWGGSLASREGALTWLSQNYNLPGGSADAWLSQNFLGKGVRVEFQGQPYRLFLV